MVANRVVGAVFLAILVVTCQGTPVKPRISDEHNIDDCDVTKATKPLLETNTFEDGQFLTIKEKVINYQKAQFLLTK
ncbi:hypothetical protein NQ317_005098 [Molorchus minor]|uniref:Uncharacterized protein n=1 Tax=Molorchus minor TaxID=1323400 RepID=A0ABQ9JFI6_9CUCU|nr:hypothetical protein NQ317_005098 [Molorchus minor]